MSASPGPAREDHAAFMRLALDLAPRGYGSTSPNPMVGAMLVKSGKIIGCGWHHRAGLPHAEIEALRDAERHERDVRGADLYVTLEPCSTYGRTPPCTEAIIKAGLRRVIVGAVDPNPAHSGRGLRILKRAGMKVVSGVLADACEKLNEGFNHWIVRRRPFVTVKAAMTIDGRIATKSGESKWITGLEARAQGMKMRQGADAILVGVNTILADDPSLTYRPAGRVGSQKARPLRRIVLDSRGRTPLTARILNDEFARETTIVVTKHASAQTRNAIEKKCGVLVAPGRKGKIDVAWLLNELGGQEVVNLLVEGGGEVNASFLLGRFAQRVGFFYAPKIFGGRSVFPGVAGNGVSRVAEAIRMKDVEWKRLGEDLYLTARIVEPAVVK